MDFSYYVLSLPLAYGTDVDAVTALLKETAASLQGEEQFGRFILMPLEMIGVDAFEENAVRLKARIKTAPQKQWFVGRELRKRLLAEMGRRGIEMWSPQRTVAVNSTTPSSPRPK
jgi:small conductance mechanosensitive channel